MDREEIIKKAETGEGLTVEEIKIYQEAVRPKKQVYGKYGTLAKEYLENHNIGKLWSLADDLPEYLHGIDKAAEDLYDTMYEKWCREKNTNARGLYYHVKRRTP
ncbi:MAG: TnpV protein [Christensenellaceae bacterium]